MVRSGTAVCVVALILALVSELLSPTLAHAGGLGISPPAIDLQEALRGADYSRTVTIVNGEDTDLTLQVTGDGEVGKWISVYSFDAPTVAVTKFVALANSRAQVILRVNVPANTPNALYKGRVMFTSAPGTAGSQSSVGALLGIAADLVVDVTGTQKLEGKVLDMGADDVEVDRPPMRITTVFQNTGNVKAQPLIRMQVKDAKGAVAGEGVLNSVVVEPAHIERIKLEWDVTGKPAGKYVASVAVTLGDTQVAQRDLGFEVLPKGTLTRLGVLDNLSLESQPQVGVLGKLVGNFRNTGQIDTESILTVEMYRGSALVKLFESRPRVVAVGESATLEAFFDVSEAGDYKLRGKVSYEGKETATQELSFRVGLPAGNGQVPTVWLAAGLAAVLLVAVAGWFLRGVRRRTPVTVGARRP